jgi:proteasome lid subunit RPN8/RPN11
VSDTTLERRLAAEGLLPSIYDAVVSAYPEEGCGFVFETPDGELKVLATVNRATQLHKLDPELYPRDGRDSFEPDMTVWLRAEREGLIPRLIFHSHPDEGSYFSPMDTSQALFTDPEGGGLLERHPGLGHMVVSVLGPEATPAMARVFRFSKETQSFEQVAEYDAGGAKVA